MMHRIRRLGAMLGLSFLALAAGVVANAPQTVFAQPHARPSAQPNPFVLPSLAPASEATTLPYPAYGTPAPGLAPVPAPGVPQKIPLTQAIAIGFERSPVLGAARADVGVARAAVRLQRAGQMPGFSAAVTTDRAHQQPGAISGFNNTGNAGGIGFGSNIGSATNGRASDFTNTGVSASLRQLIFDGGRVAASVRSAKRTETAFADLYRRQLQTVAFNVASAYYTYLAAQRTTAVDLEIVRLDTVQENLVSAQIRAGTAARVDLVTAQLPTAQARLAVVRAQGAELGAQAAFANAMGLDANTDVRPVDDTPVFSANRVQMTALPTYAEAIGRATALRPDYDASLQQLAASRENYRFAKLGLFPTLNGSGVIASNSSDANSGSFRNSNSIGVTLAVPIYDQGITAANRASAQANVDKSTANLQATILGIQVNVRQALTTLISARAGVDQAQAEYEKAITLLQATRAQYRAGVTTLPLLLNAQVGLTQALTDEVNAVYALRQAEQQFKYSTGEIGL